MFLRRRSRVDTHCGGVLLSLVVLRASHRERSFSRETRGRCVVIVIFEYAPSRVASVCDEGPHYLSHEWGDVLSEFATDDEEVELIEDGKSWKRQLVSNYCVGERFERMFIIPSTVSRILPRTSTCDSIEALGMGWYGKLFDASKCVTLFHLLIATGEWLIPVRNPGRKVRSFGLSPGYAC